MSVESLESLPLAAYERFHTHDLDEARAQGSDAFPPHQLRLAGRGARLDARLNGVTLGRTALFSVDYGAEIEITAGAWESYFLVEIPLAGAAEVSHGRDQIVATPTLASVLSPTKGVSMHWEAGNPQIVARFDRSALESHLGSMLGRELRRPLSFSLGMDLTEPHSRSWLSIANLLRREAEAGDGMLGEPLIVKQLEGVLMSQLLLAQPSNYTPALLGEQPRVAPPAVKRAMELIEARAAEPLTVENIAEAVGVGARALQEGFRRHLGSTPMGYLRDVRLERAHAELIVCGPGTAKVAEIAHRWGFVHPGRFSIAYRQRFGETPSETLRR